MKTFPRNARWQLIDPRWFAGLMGGEGPPFGVLHMDFARNSGRVQRFHSWGAVSRLQQLGSNFSASYTIQGKSGSFTAEMDTYGDLEFGFTGSVKLECSAKLRGFNSDSKIAILTCICNGTWVGGPGHSAIIADDKVYTFEDIVGGAFQSQSGWLVIDVNDYLGKKGNKIRPIVIQELDRSRVSPGPVNVYINTSMARDDDYGGSGVCSSQVASAIDRGLRGSFNPTGVDEPYEVYELAKMRRLVSREYVIWDPQEAPSDKRPEMAEKLAKKYPGVAPAKRQDVRDWRSPL